MEGEILDNPVVQHLEGLAKELSCSICLSVMETPVARLPCCHYFCQECITESVRHKPACPVCKTRATRRDIADDTTMDRVVQAFKTLQEHKTGMAEALVAARARPATDPANAIEEDVDAIPWLRGVENHEFRSPSKSLSGTQLERMRGRQSERSPSPATVQKGATSRRGEQVEQQASSPITKVKATANGRSSSKKQQQQSDASGSKSAGAGKRAPPPGTQSIQKFLQKKTASPEEKNQEKEQQGDTVAKDTTTAVPQQNPAVPAKEDSPQADSPSSQLGEEEQDTMAQQLDAIVAGLDSCEEPEPMEAEAAIVVNQAPAADAAATKTVAKECTTKTPLAPATARHQASTAKPQQRKRGGGSNTGSGDKVGDEIATTKRGRKRSAESPAEMLNTKDTDGDDGGSAKRRIPTRLLPWNCATCTFENKGGEHKCEMCQNLRIGGPTTTGGGVTGGNSTAVTGGITGTSTPAAIPAAQQDPDTATPVARAGSKASGGGGRRGAAGSLQRRAQTQAQAQASPAEDVAAQQQQKEQQQKQRKLTARKGKAPGAQTAPQQRSRLAQVGGGADTQILAPSKENTNNNNNNSAVVQWTGGKASWVLLGSGLDSEGKAKLRALASTSGCTVVDKWSPKVTHVVCGGATPDRTARRTFKYLMGVLTGRWVVGEGWVNACLGGGKAAEEVDFEIEVDSMGCAGGPSRGRAARAACESKHAKHAHAARTHDNGSNEALLKGYEVQLVGEFGCKTQVVDLVRAAGGKVTARLPTKGASGGAPGGVVLVEVPDTSPAAAQGFKAAVAEESWFARAMGAEVPVVSHRWLTDSISKLELCSMQEFAV